MKVRIYIQRAMKLIIDAKQGKIDYDEALDGLWELLVNIDYEINHASEIRHLSE